MRKISAKEWNAHYKPRATPKEYNSRNAEVWRDRVRASVKSAQALSSEDCNGLAVKAIRHRLQIEGKALGYSVATTQVGDELWFKATQN